jgi:hypothetical protein
MVTKAMNNSMNFLEQILPFELTSRYLATNMTILNRDCQYYFKQVVSDSDQRAKICSMYNFANLADVQEVLAATWYGGAYLDSFIAKTALSPTQVSQFFGQTTANTFGYDYVQQLQTIYHFHNCTAPVGQVANCTGNELAQIQWASSNLTTNIPAAFEGKSVQYLRKAHSIKDSFVSLKIA